MREASLDLLREARRRHMIHALLEVDVTFARQVLRRHKARTGESLSFTAFVITCLARAVDEDRIMHAYRNWRNQLVLFDEVDVNTMVERRINGRVMGTPNILRAANKKTFRQLHDEIRAAQGRATEETPGMEWFRWTTWLARLPTFLRGWMWRLAGRNPRWVKQFAGTVAVTSVGMLGRGVGWGITIPFLTLNLVVGSIVEKPAWVFDHLGPREFLHLTLSFDHAVVDGAPAARFSQRLTELLQSGYGLPPTEAN